MRFVRPAAPFALLFATAFSRTASAEKIAGTFRLSLDATVLDYSHTTISAPDPPPGVKPSVDIEASQTTVGLVGSGVGLGLAGAVDDNIVIGGKFSVGSTETDVPYSSSSSATAITLMPLLEIIPVSSGSTLPFISISGGYRRATSSPSVGNETTASGWLVGAGCGSHWFATPSFSVDPAVSLFYANGSVESGPTSLNTSGVEVWVSLGISGWIPTVASNAGTGEPTEPKQPDRVPAAEPAPPRVVDDRGRLTTSFALETLPTDPPGQRLRVVVNGEPRTDGATAGVTVTGLVTAGKEPTACSALSLEVDGTTTPLTDVRPTTQAGFSAAEVTLQGKVEVRVLEKLGESRSESAIVSCGVRHAIAPASRVNVYEWMEQFRSKARTAGTWKETR